ncbi:MAG: hypothetical protein K9K64_01060 [Desulfohalobiaceae bacterium]|nr:hypothetical protein [Desulfohalobiaceae bacterium]
MSRSASRKQVRFLPRRTFLKLSAFSSALALSSALRPRISLAKGKTILKVRDYGDITSLDPGIASNLYDENVNACIYSKLISYKPGNKWDWQLDAAESVEQVDPTHIAFTLKKGIRFSNDFGEMTAEDVKYSFERIADPTFESPIQGDWKPLDQVQVKDRYSGVIVLKEPFQALWMTTLPYMAGNIVSKKAVESVGGKYTHEPPACSGPYVFKEWKPKQRTVLKRNELWSGPAADFDEIWILPIDDEKTAEIAFEAGDIDYTRMSISSFPKYSKNPPANSTVKKYPSLYYVWVGMNLENPKLQDKRVRRAVQYAVDVPSILQAAYFGVAEPATGIIPPGLCGHREESLIPPKANIEKARQLLKEAGHPNGISLTLDARNKETYLTSAQVIQATLAQAGIKLEIKVHDSGSFWSLGDDSKGDRWKDIQLVHNRFSSAPDPYYAAQWFTDDQIGIWNWERFDDKEYNSLHEKAISESDREKRCSMYKRMQDIMEGSGAYRFITHEANPVIYRNTIRPALRPDGMPLLRYFEKA